MCCYIGVEVINFFRKGKKCLKKNLINVLNDMVFFLVSLYFSGSFFV